MSPGNTASWPRWRCSWPPPATEILVGTITDLSGVTAVQGVNNANAIRLAFDDVNEKGGINGRRDAVVDHALVY